MRVTLAQLDARPTLEENLEVVTRVVRESPRSLIAFPELALNGYDLSSISSSALDLTQLAPVVETAREAESIVVVGFAERLAGGVANSAAVVAPDGTPIGVYRKTHLFGAEREVFAAGDKLLTFDIGSVPLGVLICFDIEFPETARTLVRRGAEVLVTISANMRPFGPDHDAFVRARALETHTPHVYVNRVGAQGGFEFVGESQAVRSDGSVVLRLGHCEEVATIDLSNAAVDARVDYAMQRRPELYD